MEAKSLIVLKKVVLEQNKSIDSESTENGNDFTGQKRVTFSKARMIAALKKVSITNELMQQNSITEENLWKLIEDDGIEIFKELPFVSGQLSGGNYTFSHKNYQEYFAAKYISDFHPQNIIHFIKADGLNKVKPNLFNTTTFLLNILDGEKFEVLKKWLLENDIEIRLYINNREKILFNMAFFTILEKNNR